MVKAEAIVASAMAAVVLSSCARYEPRPLPDETELQQQEIVSSGKIIAAVSSLHHPTLRDVAIDLDRPWTPDEVALLAVVLNPGLRSLRDQRGNAAAQVVQAGILPNPQLSAGFEVPVAGELEGTATGFSYGVGWEITSLIGRDARRRAAARQADAIDLGIAWQEWQVAAAARQAFYRVLGARSRKMIAADAAERAKQMAALIAAGVAAGHRTTVDLASADLAAREAAARAQDTAREAEQQRLSLMRIVGLSPTADPVLDATSFPSAAPEDGTLEQELVQRRIDLQALRRGYAAQEEAVRAAVLGQFPKISLSFLHARDTGNVQAVGPALTVDLPLFDRNQGAIAAETATRRRLFDEYRQRVFEARHDLAEALSEARYDAGRLRIAEQARLDLEARRRAADDAFARGLIDAIAADSAASQATDAALDAALWGERLAEARIAVELAAGCYLPGDGESDR